MKPEDNFDAPLTQERIEALEELYQLLPPGPTAEEIDDYLDFLAAMY